MGTYVRCRVSMAPGRVPGLVPIDADGARPGFISIRRAVVAGLLQEWRPDLARVRAGFQGDA